MNKFPKAKATTKKSKAKGNLIPKTQLVTTYINKSTRTKRYIISYRLIGKNFYMFFNNGRENIFNIYSPLLLLLKNM